MQENSATPTEAATPHYFGDMQSNAKMFQMIFGGSIAQAVHAAAYFSLAEHISDGRNTPEAIARAESLHVEATFRLMRTCASLGLLSYDAGSKTFAATPLLNTLHRDNPASMRGVAMLIPAHGHWAPWGRLCEAVRTGEPQSVAALGCGAWDYLSESPDEAAAFSETMKSTALVFNRDAAKLVDIGGSQVAVDVGGANGTFIHALMQANPGLNGMVFDLPHVVPTATAASIELGLQDRFSVMAGSFLEEDPPAADLYLLKLIMHDWNDETCLSILRRCRRAINQNGRIIVVEQILEEIGQPGFLPLLDLDMLVMLGGKERTLNEFTDLFAAAGFRFLRMTRTSTPFVILEAAAI